LGKLIETLFEIKTRLAAIGIDLSDNKFSLIMMSKSARYISWLRATHHEPSLNCMVSLHSRLGVLSERFEQSGKPKASKAVNEMAEGLWDAIRHASLMQVPKRRPTAERRNQPQDVAEIGV